MRAVEDERYAIVEGVIEFHFEMFICVFREKRPPFCKVLHLGIVVNIEVLGLEDVPLKISVLHFVPTEVEKLCVALRCSENNKEEDLPEDTSFHRGPVRHSSIKRDCWMVVEL